MNKIAAYNRILTAASRAHGQSGLSLVELMIALVLSSFLMGGLINMAISGKDSYNFQRTQAITQENSRYATEFVDNIVRRAGYLNEPQNTREGIFTYQSVSATCDEFEMGQVISNSRVGVGICLRYQRAEAGELDCTGTQINSDDPIITRVYFDASTNSLLCAAQNAAPVTLIEDIENMQLTFGITDEINDNAKSIDAYTSNPVDWREVIAVRFSFLTASENSVRTEHQAYHFPLDSTVETEADDYRTYRSSQQTVVLRNLVL